MIDIEARPGKALRAVNGDPAQIEQILVNLALNAKDAMPEGGNLIIQTENVTVDDTNRREHPDRTPGAYVVLSVSDTGCGMDDATSDQCGKAARPAPRVSSPNPMR
ncbi:ATP-binding protein [bacterium]|nr:ATP-binding protein [bacterium]